MLDEKSGITVTSGDIPLNRLMVKLFNESSRRQY